MNPTKWGCAMVTDTHEPHKMGVREGDRSIRPRSTRMGRMGEKKETFRERTKVRKFDGAMKNADTTKGIKSPFVPNDHS